MHDDDVMHDDDDGIDPIGCIVGLFFVGCLLIVTGALLLKFIIHAFRWAMQ